MGVVGPVSPYSPHEIEESRLDPSGPRIRCPLCGWSPRKDDFWSCTCGHIWNTTPNENHFAILQTGEMGID